MFLPQLHPPYGYELESHLSPKNVKVPTGFDSMAHLDDPIMALEDRQGALTFGVEIEFLVPVIEGVEEGE